MEVALLNQLSRNNIKRDLDVTELYLADQGEKEIPKLNQFKNLQRLFLNNNKIIRVGDSLQSNYVITELYLENNMLTDVAGALQHLSCMRILLLHGNQLADLRQMVHEFRNMQDLKTLNLHGNPLAQDFCYREFVIYSIPSLELLDRKAVLGEEREKVQRKFDPQQRVRETISFGRRVEQRAQSVEENDGDQCANEGRKTRTPSPTKKTAHYEELEDIQTNYPDSSTDSMQKKFILKHMSPEERFAASIETRGRSRSIVQYSVFNWVDQLEKRRDRAPTEPTIFTTRFR